MEPATNRYDRLREALAVDLVLTAQQIETHYGITERQLKHHGYPTTRRLIKDRHTARKYTPTTYVALDPSTLQDTDTNLMHLSGTAEIRHQLRAPPHEWTIHPKHTNENTPDATWNKGGTTPTAIEYDTGSYSRKRIKEKTLAYLDYTGGQIWGTPGPERARNVQTIIRLHDDTAQVITANPTKPT